MLEGNLTVLQVLIEVTFKNIREGLVSNGDLMESRTKDGFLLILDFGLG